MGTELYLYDRENGDTGSDPVGIQNPLPTRVIDAGPLASPNSAIAVTAVTVGTTAKALVTSPLANRRSICVFNGDTASIYVGPSTITSGTGAATAGFDVPASTSFSADLGPGVSLFAISAAGTAAFTVKVLEVS